LADIKKPLQNVGSQRRVIRSLKRYPHDGQISSCTSENLSGMYVYLVGFVGQRGQRYCRCSSIGYTKEGNCVISSMTWYCSRIVVIELVIIGSKKERCS
ncbi:33076_t:CDS:2, partial [Racocetra persica]